MVQRHRSNDHDDGGGGRQTDRPRDRTAPVLRCDRPAVGPSSPRDTSSGEPPRRCGLWRTARLIRHLVDLGRVSSPREPPPDSAGIGAGLWWSGPKPPRTPPEPLELVALWPGHGVTPLPETVFGGPPSRGRHSCPPASSQSRRRAISGTVWPTRCRVTARRRERRPSGSDSREWRRRCCATSASRSGSGSRGAGIAIGAVFDQGYLPAAVAAANLVDHRGIATRHR